MSKTTEIADGRDSPPRGSRPQGSRPRGLRPGGLRNGWPRQVRLLLAAFVIAVGAWLVGLLWFALEIPDNPSSDSSKTDAIVVLTGGSGRIEEGLALFERRRAKELFVSGVDRSVDLPALLRVRHRDIDAMSCCIRLGRAVDTIGNALETARWMRAKGFGSLRLVTASYHMQRSLMEFRRAMPDITVIAHPTFPKGFDQDRWWARFASSRLLVREYHKYLAASLRIVIADAVMAMVGDETGVAADAGLSR